MIAPTQPAWLGLHFSFVIALSAFLLFQVQPLIGKFILPWFGGSPAVWTTCMLFFQCLLFAGYAYAHASVRFLPKAGQMTLHAALLVLAVALFPVVPDPAFKPTDGSDPTWRIVWLLARAVGLPYFMLSTTGPLVQAWFSRVFPGKSPYRLYSLSNIGSFAALLSYPFFFETIWDVRTQAYVWRGGFLLFAVACAAVAYFTFQHAASGTQRERNADKAAQEDFAWWQPLAWTLLPAWASMVFLATTNHLCQDVAPIPFLWIVPLSLYLLTFIICFDHERWYVRGLFAALMLIAVCAVAGDSFYYFLKQRFDYRLHYTQEVTLLAATMFLICMVCHGEIVRLRPHANHLTLFYMLVSLGGALGGIFVSLIAPRIWTDYYEWQLALYGSLLLGLAVLAVDRIAKGGAALVYGGLAAAGGLAGIGLFHSWMEGPDNLILDQARNFYGVSAIEETDQGTASHHRLMWHGSTAHGRQYVSDDLSKRRTPVGYYGVNTGIGQAIRHFNRLDSARVCTIGLGAGTLAAYARAGDAYRFYEINDEVIRQAREYFTYLADCPAPVEIVPGDARLMLEQEFARNGSHRFHVICVDAFSGDSIPAHLITTEAMRVYLDHLENREEGIICVNIKNRYIDLWPVMKGLAREHKLQIRRIAAESDYSQLLYDTDFVLLTNNRAFLESTPNALPEEGNSPKEVPLWRDDFNNLFQILK
jgi:hypothetical protein